MAPAATAGVQKFELTVPPRVFMNYQGRQTTCVPSPCTSQPKALLSFLQPLVGPAQWAYQAVPGGYEYELLMPWAVLGRSTPPPPGTVVAADLGLVANGS